MSESQINYLLDAMNMGGKRCNNYASLRTCYYPI